MESQFCAVVTASVALFASLGYSSAADFNCPNSTEQFNTEVRADLTSHAQDILRQNTDRVADHIETTVSDLYSKYPGADRIVVVRDLMSVTCQLIRNSESLTDDEKLNRWFQFVSIARSFLPQTPFEQSQQTEQKQRTDRIDKSVPAIPKLDAVPAPHPGMSFAVQAVGLDEPTRLIGQALETQLQNAGFVMDPERPTIIFVVEVEARTVGRRLDGPDEVLVTITKRSTNPKDELASTRLVQAKSYEWRNPNSSSRNVAEQLYSLLLPSMRNKSSP